MYSNVNKWCRMSYQALTLYQSVVQMLGGVVLQNSGELP